MTNELFSLFTIAYISWTLLWSVLDIQYNLGENKCNPIKNEATYFTFAFFYSLFSCSFPLVTNSIGKRGTDCWIKDGNKIDFAWEWIDYLIPVILVILWNFGCLIYAIKLLKKFKK